MKRSLQIAFICILLTSTYLNTSRLYAQEITGIEIIPEIISSNDDVFMVISTSFPFLDCSLDSIHEFFGCGALSWDGFYNTGFETGDCSRSDTINIGMLPNGPYLISYHMYYLGWAQVDQIDTFITVGTTGIEHLKEGNSSIRIWPNPSHGMINISVEEQAVDRLMISSLDGMYSKEISFTEHTAQINNKLSLPPGMYICTSFSKDRPISRNKFIILE